MVASWSELERARAFVLGGERFERQELDVGGAVHVIRSRNRLRHENASDVLYNSLSVLQKRN